MLVPMARAFGYSTGRLRQTPLNREYTKKSRAFFVRISHKTKETTE